MSALAVFAVLALLGGMTIGFLLREWWARREEDREFWDRLRERHQAHCAEMDALEAWYEALRSGE